MASLLEIPKKQNKSNLISKYITKIINKNRIINIHIFPGTKPLIININNNNLINTCNLSKTKDIELKNIINNIPIHKKLTDHINNIDIKCSSCCSNYSEDKEYILLPCFHVSCIECIKNWNKTCILNGSKASCPDCRTKLQHSINPDNDLKFAMSAPVNNNFDPSNQKNKKQKIYHSQVLERCSSISYSQSQYEGNDGISFSQEEINQNLRNENNPLASSELNFNGSISRTEECIKINLENDDDGFPKINLPKDSQSFDSFKGVFVKCISEKGSTNGYNDLLAYICDEKDNFEIINYDNKNYNINGVEIKHSGDHTSTKSIGVQLIDCLFHSCTISSDYNIIVTPLNIPFVEHKTGYKDEHICSKVYDDEIKTNKPEKFINEICLDLKNKLPKKDKELISTIFIIQSIYEKNNYVFKENDKFIPSLAKLSPKMKPSCTILTKNKNDSTNELSIKPILLNWSDEPAATIWAAIQVYK